MQNTALRVCFQIYDPTDISIKNLHEKAGIVPIDLRRKYLQGVLCYRMINIGALNLVNNRQTRAADGPLVVTYLAHTERIRKSPPVNAVSEWNMIPSRIRLSKNKVCFKRALKKVVKKFFVKKWLHILQFTNEAPENIYINLE